MESPCDFPAQRRILPTTARATCAECPTTAQVALHSSADCACAYKLSQIFPHPLSYISGISHLRIHSRTKPPLIDGQKRVKFAINHPLADIQFSTGLATVTHISSHNNISRIGGEVPQLRLFRIVGKIVNMARPFWKRFRWGGHVCAGGQ
jgi:hypothetical protein